MSPSSTANADRRSPPATSGEAVNAFGRRLRGWREEQGLTLRHVSEASGISIAYLSDLERGKLINPTLDTLTALARALGVSLNKLLGLEPTEAVDDRYPAALEELRQVPAFRDAVTSAAARWRQPIEEVEDAWLRSLAGIRLGRRAPRTASDYLFVFEAARRVLE